MNELELFMKYWERESANTVRMLEALPEDGFDVRADPAGRSLGELAWHLAGIDGYMSHAIEARSFATRPERAEAKRDLTALRAQFQRGHEETVARLRKLKPEDLDQEIVFLTGRPMRIADILWYAMLFHSIHHRGQLAVMIRLAGGRCAGMYGPVREEMEAMMNARQA